MPPGTAAPRARARAKVPPLRPQSTPGGTTAASSRAGTRSGPGWLLRSRCRDRAPAARPGSEPQPRPRAAASRWRRSAEPKQPIAEIVGPGSSDDVASTARIATSAPQPISESDEHAAAMTIVRATTTSVSGHGSGEDQIDVAVLEVTTEHVRRHDEIGEQRERNSHVAPLHVRRDERDGAAAPCVRSRGRSTPSPAATTDPPTTSRTASHTTSERRSPATSAVSSRADHWDIRPPAREMLEEFVDRASVHRKTGDFDASRRPARC